ncbi:Serine carboxypeptidase 24 [Dichanthelium oligosanthes]|uniref:Carboxypeptidase n=1 Tax=Dichanthelium oligosanthes TaxID=888268 RepID=A0A1E5VLY7_9POAL|nr:Serine carboxypeptidase 24 [Dichanthelium oligosanthes]
MGSSCRRCSPLASKIIRDAFSIQLFCLILIQASHADEAGRLQEFSRSRMEMQHDRIDNEMLTSWSMDHPIYVGPQDGLKKVDKISELPGQPGQIVFDQYAGYVTVDETSGKALFYYFVEAAEEPSTKPLVLWLNGGPGCSSLGGAMLEIGPFFVNRDNKTLSRNKYAWNNVANMLFLESPAGVGFSYSNRTSDYNNTGDKSTAEDAYTFLVNWLERFLEYKGHNFFITGESYGGHYIPQLANTILLNNKIMNTTMVNLKGVAIGNAYLDDDTNTRATIDYYWTHAMISKETHKAVQENCSFNGTYTELCRTAIEAANNEKGLIDQSNIYASFCWDASAPQQHHTSVTNSDPCASYYLRSYLNRQEVQRAFHANTTGLKQPWLTTLCMLMSTSHIISPENWKDAQGSMLPSIQQLISSGVSTWLYSVANTATRNQSNQPLEFDNFKLSSKYVQGKQDSTLKNGTSPSVHRGTKTTLREQDKIVSMPGQTGVVEFEQYAGYITVDAKAGRALFYYFVAAPQDPLDKPLVLWLNGVANMLFVEIPAGVGYSYSNTTLDYYNTGDQRTTGDAYTFLVNWLEKFPEYRDRDFFITGESYAGHYIPELANLIVSKNRATNATNVKLKGVAIGNADLDDNLTLRASFDYYWMHAMISSKAYRAIKDNCGFNGTYTKDCQNAMNLATQEKGNVDDYDIYAPTCHDASNSSKSSYSLVFGDPCTNHYVSSYLNRPEVQKALHANTTGLDYPWMDCSEHVLNNWKDSPETMLPSIKKLISSGIRIWLYSGDMDAVCSFISTQYVLDILGLPIETSWRPWRIDNEVAGYVVGYKGLVFATVRGAGHMVPYYQPRRALALFSSFLEGKLPPQ